MTAHCLKVKGHSGCGVELVDQHVVRKFATHVKTATRLQRQIQKQVDARRAHYFSWLRIPRIIAEKRSDDAYSVDMEYIVSQDFAHYFAAASKNDIDLQIERLTQFIDAEVAACQMCCVEGAQIVDKYHSVMEVAGGTEYAIFKGLRASMDAYVQNNVPAQLTLPCGVCHGDLTFSNILFDENNGRLALIDFLDAFLETPLQDIVKLRQDTRHRWSERMCVARVDSIKLGMIFDYMDAALMHHFARYDWYNAYYDLFQFVNLVRILPYVTDAAVHFYLLEQIHTLI